LSGNNKITAKIHEETAGEVQAIMAEAQKKADASAAKINAAAQAKVQEIQIQAKADAEEAGRRQILIAELETARTP
jgi:V/A-type H+-transporting ATPase subunit E